MKIRNWFVGVEDRVEAGESGQGGVDEDGGE